MFFCLIDFYAVEDNSAICQAIVLAENINPAVSRKLAVFADNELSAVLNGNFAVKHALAVKNKRAALFNRDFCRIVRVEFTLDGKLAAVPYEKLLFVVNGISFIGGKGPPFFFFWFFKKKLE